MNIGEYIIYRNVKSSGMKFVASIILNCVGFILFNIANWMYAHLNFKSSQELAYKIENKEVPRSTVMATRILNWILVSLNFIIPVLLAYAYTIPFFWNKGEATDDKYLEMGNISYMLTLLLPIVSGFFLLSALYNINKMIV